ncbi:MAG: nucleotidyl transferase AbiEii/AbiGii toxin family protein, partial [Rhizobiales bacterium]|nr:nucleotidyl transferase AbiEii/AbiGii toxin family protein [Hyphomicrobiales bacterium]
IFADNALAKAIAATFARRKTGIPEQPPDALTPAFAGDPAKQQQWTAFLQGIETDLLPLADVVADLAAFVMPHAQAARAIQG